MVAVVALLVVARLFIASFDTDSYILFPRVRPLLLLPSLLVSFANRHPLWRLVELITPLAVNGVASGSPHNLSTTLRRRSPSPTHSPSLSHKHTHTHTYTPPHSPSCLLG